MFTFKSTTPPIFVFENQLEICLSTNALNTGSLLALKANKSKKLIVLEQPRATRDGWRYTLASADGSQDWFMDIGEGTIFEVAGSVYADPSWEWAPAPEEIDEVLTPQQAVALAIKTLQNFEDEYSDVGPIIERLRKSLGK